MASGRKLYQRQRHGALGADIYSVVGRTGPPVADEVSRKHCVNSGIWELLCQKVCCGIQNCYVLAYHCLSNGLYIYSDVSPEGPAEYILLVIFGHRTVLPEC